MRTRWVSLLISLAAVLFAANRAEAGCDRPPTPTGVTAVAMAMNVIELTWAGGGPYYDIFIRNKDDKNPSEAPDITGGDKNQHAHTFRNLLPNTEFRFALRSRTEGNKEGCVSQNTSLWAVTRTPTFETDQTCKTYAQAAEAQLAAMTANHCPASPPRWDPNQNAHYLFCLADVGAGHANYANERKARDDAVAACNAQKAASILPTGDILKVFNENNRHRADHCTPALQWSAKLAVDAQTSANRCPTSHNTAELQAENEGENLYYGSGTGSGPQAATDFWYNEFTAYNFNAPVLVLDPKQGAVNGHFTQMVWKATSQIGCASKVCGDSTYYSCRYAPPGNFNAQPSANVSAATAVANLNANVLKKCR